MAKAKRSHSEGDIATVHPDAAAIDIGARMHVAAVRPDRDPEPVRSFGTFTGDLQRLADWFAQCGVRTVAMESTGVYWIPAYEILEQRGFEVVLVNARDAKHVPPARRACASSARSWLVSGSRRRWQPTATDAVTPRPRRSARRCPGTGTRSTSTRSPRRWSCTTPTRARSPAATGGSRLF